MDHIAAGKAFYETKKATGDYHEHPEGFLYRFIGEGQTGKGESKNKTPKPTATQEVEVHYAGRLIDNEDGTPGKEFDSSYKRGETITFGLNQVIKGWGLAVQQMSQGDEIECILPQNLAYGARGAGADIPGGATLVFKIAYIFVEPTEIELAGIEYQRVARESGEYLEGPKGILYKWIVPPTEGEEHPTATDEVTAHYEGKTIKDEIFDSSYKRGKPSAFALNQVIEGWTLMVPLMTKNSKMQLIIPARSAYGKSSPSKLIQPWSTLIFTIELFSWKPAPQGCPTM
jgi:FKBP-type peptidyl-prolyl cis-trans isomerase